MRLELFLVNKISGISVATLSEEQELLAIIAFGRMKRHVAFAGPQSEGSKFIFIFYIYIL